MLCKEGNLEGALVHLNKLLQSHPESLKLLDLSGVIHLEMSRYSEALVIYKKIASMNPVDIEFKQNLAKSYFGLAEEKRKDLDYEQAIVLYREATAANELMDIAHQNLGLLLKYTGDIKGAISSLKIALDINPANESVQHNLNALLGKKTKKAPKQYVSDSFDQYAEKFEIHLMTELGYQMPVFLRKFTDKIDNREFFTNGIDLGCGTGIAGSIFTEKVKYFEGIDLSQNMLKIAAKKKIYHKLTREDIETYLRSSHMKYDLFIASDVFIYVGDLEEIFKLVSEKSNEGAIFAFSTEHVENEDFKLLSSARYGHSRGYIQSLNSKYKLEEKHFSVEPLRKEKNTWLEGGVYVLKKGSAQTP